MKIMSPEFFWPSLIMVASACIICFCAGFNTGRIFQQDRDAEYVAHGVTQEEVEHMIAEAISKRMHSQ